MQVAGALFMNSLAQNTTTFKSVILSSARIIQEVCMTGARFDGTLNASYIEVGGNLSMESDAANRTTFEDVNLTGAKIKGKLDMSGADFEGALHGETLHVDGNLLMQSDLWREPSFKRVDINGATVSGSVSMIGASFDGPLYAGLLRVGGNLEMGSLTAERLKDLARRVGSLPEYRASQVKFKQVFLTGSKVEGNILIPDTSIEGAVDASFLQVGGNMNMPDSRFADQVEMGLAHIGGSLDLSGAGLAGLDLSGASIAADLKLGGAHKSALCKGNDCKPAALNLRNVHIGSRMDARNDWPTQGQLHLEGLTFGRLGGIDGDTGPQMHDQEAKWWDNWARRDPGYSPATYAQLAAAFTNSGDRDAADDIRYFRREREREMACKEGLLGSCVLQTVLGSVGRLWRGLTYIQSYTLGAWLLAGWRAAALVDGSSGEKSWSNLVFLRQSGAALARDHDQQRAHRLLQRPRAQEPQGLAGLRVLRPRRRRPGVGSDPAHRRLRTYTELVTQTVTLTAVEFIGSHCWHFQWFAGDFSAGEKPNWHTGVIFRQLERISAFHPIQP